MPNLSIPDSYSRNKDKPKNNLDNVVKKSGFLSPNLKRIATYTAGVIAALLIANTAYAGVHKPKNPTQSSYILSDTQETVESDNQKTINLEELLNARINTPESKEVYEPENLYSSELLEEPVDEKIDVFIQIDNFLYIISYNGERELKEMDLAPFIEEYRTMVPIRFIAEGLGADIGWNGEEKKVIIDYKDKEIDFYIGNKSYTITSNGATETKQLDIAPEIVNGRTVIPLRAAAEAMGAKLTWNSDILMVVIEQTDKTHLNLYSDYDEDGVPLWKEMIFKSDPHNKYSLSDLIPDGEIISWAETEGVDIRHYETKNGLGVVANAYFGFNPYKESNFGLDVNDKEVLEYALNHGIKTVNKDDLSRIIKLFNNQP